jgi:hypothetical protein
MKKKVKKKKDFEKHSCELKNEEECEDELADDNVSLEDAEEEMFVEDEV